MPTHQEVIEQLIRERDDLQERAGILADALKGEYGTSERWKRAYEQASRKIIWLEEEVERLQQCRYVEMKAKQEARDIARELKTLEYDDIRDRQRIAALEATYPWLKREEDGGDGK